MTLTLLHGRRGRISPARLARARRRAAVSRLSGLRDRSRLLRLVAVSFDLLLGFTGLLSFGHAMFWGGGGYVATILDPARHASFLLAVWAACVRVRALAARRRLRGPSQRDLLRDDHARHRADRLFPGLPARRPDRRRERPSDRDARYALRALARERPGLLLSRAGVCGRRHRLCDSRRDLAVRPSLAAMRENEVRAQSVGYVRGASRSPPSCFRARWPASRARSTRSATAGRARRGRLAHLGRDRHDDDPRRHRHDLRTDRRRRGLSSRSTTSSRRRRSATRRTSSWARLRDRHPRRRRGIVGEILQRAFAPRALLVEDEDDPDRMVVEVEPEPV